MRTTCIFLVMSALCIAFIIFINTKKGKEWFDKVNKY